VAVICHTLWGIMCIPGRFTATLAAMTLLLGAAAVALAGSAQALTVVQIAGSAPAVVHGPATVVFTYTITVPADIGSTSFTTHQAAALPASVSGATVDGVPVPAAQITQPSSVDLTIQTGAAQTDGLTTGVHTITFNASVGGGPAVSTSSTATLSWIEASVPASVTSAPVAVAVNQPDIAVSLTPSFDTGVFIPLTGFVGTGMQAFLGVDVMNLGYGTPTTTLTITLATGLVLVPDGVFRDVDGAPLSCTQIAPVPLQFSCALGSLPHFTAGADPTIGIVLTTTANPPVGTIGTITVSAAPDAGEGTDTNPANNSVSAPMKFTGVARLSSTLTPAATRVQLGRQTTVTVTIHNSGPQPAEDTVAFIELVNDPPAASGAGHFQATGFTGNTTPPPSLAGSGVTATVFPTEQLVWFVGTIAPGASSSATLTVKARTAGSSRMQLLAVSTATDPDCPFGKCERASASIQAIPVQLRPAAASPALPATGAASRALLGFGVLFLITGATLTVAARRRQAV
jgi:hypothetical protein